MASCEIEHEFNKLKELSQNPSHLNLDQSLESPIHISEDSFSSNTEAIGDADSYALTHRFKDVENEVGHVWLEVESEVRKSLLKQTHASQFNLDEDSEAVIISQNIIDEIIATSFMSGNKSQKINKNLFKYATLYNFATAGVRRSFGIHDLHRRFTMKRNKAATTEETTVESIPSNSSFRNIIDKESTEDIHEIELSEVEINVNEKLEMHEHEMVKSSTIMNPTINNSKDDLKKKKSKWSRSLSNVRKWLRFMDIFKSKKE